MRILQIGAEWPTERPGGLNTYFAELIGALADGGTSVAGLVVGSDKIKFASNGIATSFSPTEATLMKRLWRARSAATQFLKQPGVDVIAVHFALYAAPIVDQLLKLPTVQHFHGPWASESGVEGARGFSTQAKAALERAVYSRAKRLIVLSEAFKNLLIRKYRIPDEKVRVVPGGVDVGQFNVDISGSEAKERLGWPADRMVLFTIRRLVKRMGLENLIDAAALLDKEKQDFLLVIGGTGPLAGELQARIDTQGLKHCVKLVGRVGDNLPLYYRAADLSVVPSQALEGFGLVALESLASGTPVYVTPVGGLPEVVRPFAPECIFEDTSTQAMAGMLKEVLLGRRSRPAEGACRHYVVSNFTWKQVASRVLTIYNDALR